MRRLMGLLLTVGALAWGSAPAQAAQRDFVGALEIQFAPLVAPATITGTGVATTTGDPHVNSLAVPASPFNATGIALPNLNITSMQSHFTTIFGGLQLTLHNNTGSFGGGTAMGALHGPMPINGVMKVCLFVPCSGVGTLLPPANLTVPLNNLGAGGMFTSSKVVNVTTIGAPWTVGTAAVGTVSIAGFHHGPVSLTSSTASASGSIRLVTPLLLSTNIPAVGVFPTFGILDLHFVPEPSTLLLLASGIAGLVFFGRTKRC